MKIRLNSLRLDNFKGIKHISLDFVNNETTILGANASGKTTIADSFFWLLFDKDSSGRKDFEIKTIDKNGSTKKRP
jgi:exonuclease SbcC